MESNKWLKSYRGKSYKSSEGKTAARWHLRWILQGQAGFTCVETDWNGMLAKGKMQAKKLREQKKEM